MEIKTAEQYVVTKLIEAEDKIEHLKATNKYLSSIVEGDEIKIEALRKLIGVVPSYDNRAMYLQVENIYSTYDHDRFVEVCELLGLDASKLVDDEGCPINADEEDM